MALICCSVSSLHRIWNGDYCYYCEALRCSQASFVRWEGSGTLSVPPLLVMHTSHAYHEWLLQMSIFFPPSHQMFPCMGRDWRILATSPQQQRFLAEVTQESVPSRIQTVPASSMQDSQRKVMSWAKETGKWKAPNERMGKPQMRGRESPKWGEGKAQTGGRKTHWVWEEENK